MFRNLRTIAMLTGTITMCSWGLISDASGASPETADGQARYKPIQGITYDVGSKRMTGYFVRQSSACVVTLMITEKTDPEEPLGLSPTRVRLVLWPGQVAGLDTEEGKSLNFTCEHDAATLLVDIGERDRLVALQDASLVKQVAQPQ